MATIVSPGVELRLLARSTQPTEGPKRLRHRGYIKSIGTAQPYCTILSYNSRILLLARVAARLAQAERRVRLLQVALAGALEHFAARRARAAHHRPGARAHLHDQWEWVRVLLVDACGRLAVPAVVARVQLLHLLRQRAHVAGHRHPAQARARGNAPGAHALDAPVEALVELLAARAVERVRVRAPERARRGCAG
ncbi:hypothetical protein HYPSUDRAFT_44720 [Hypholoma sublateritium FD-334 SS-4]|uniref:Uncharacterized protein n=1 Tax=Hypholoma sublateritium (strain FD-334 SS-4) TaxID=945553 RepID=A0A0D2KW38_HYPSF|nr:hypothetical protein HYPSUDRAFT_44720 [Hypholoma sublateritium FD-334 SS-4]